MKNFINWVGKHYLAALFVMLWVKVVVVTWVGFNLTVETWLDFLVLLVNPIGISLLLMGLAFIFKKRFSMIGVLIAYVLLIGLLYANLLYYRFYIDFVTVSVLMQLNNVGGLGPSTLELISPLDLLLFLDIIFFVYVWRKTKQTKWQPAMPHKKKYVGLTMVLIMMTVSLALLRNPYVLQANYDREQLVESLGLYNYQVFNIINSLQSPMMKVLASDKSVEPVTNYLQGMPDAKSDYFGLAEGKNLVLISLESTQNFVINRKVNGEEITPFLNSLIEDSYYFSNIYEQAAQGKTSDAEFMIHTGLYPLSSGSVFVRRPENEFISLPKLLKAQNNYSAATFHGNSINFWNRKQMYPSLGYNQYFSQEDYHITEENSVNYGIKDIPFFEQSITHLSTLTEPYMASFLTLTNHFPFLLENEDQRIPPADTSVDVVNRYVTTVNYEDAAIERFFDLLKKEGMYEDTIFVIYGDHYGISQEFEEGVHELLDQPETPINHLQLQQIPLIIHIPGQEGAIFETIGGEIDIHATILELMGIDEEKRTNFSENLFTRDPNKPVVFRDGSMVASEYAYLNNACYSMNTESLTEEENCETYLETVRKELKLSDEIILGDLFRFME